MKKALFADMRYSLAKRSCEGELAQIINLMEGHKANDVPAGHEYYRQLEVRAQKAIVKLQNAATKLGLVVPDYKDVAVSVPALRTLENMVSGDGVAVTTDVPKMIFAGGAGAFMVGLIVTVAFALYHDLYVVLTGFHFLHR